MTDGQPRRICQRDHRAERAPLRFSYLQSREARRRGVEFPSQPAGSMPARLVVTVRSAESYADNASRSAFAYSPKAPVIDQPTLQCHR
jgi:hypothetical protein